MQNCTGFWGMQAEERLNLWRRDKHGWWRQLTHLLFGYLATTCWATCAAAVSGFATLSHNCFKIILKKKTAWCERRNLNCGPKRKDHIPSLAVFQIFNTCFSHIASRRWFFGRIEITAKLQWKHGFASHKSHDQQPHVDGGRKDERDDKNRQSMFFDDQQKN